MLLALALAFSAHIPNRNPTDVANLLAADQAGNLFIVYSSPKTSSITNIHVAKTDPQGNLLASFDFGGTGLDYANAAAVDPEGNLIVVGRSYSADFPMVSPLFKSGNSFATKIDPQLSHIIFSTRLGTVGGGPTSDSATAVAADSAGNFYIAGTTAAGFATTSGVLQSQAPTVAQVGGIEHGFVMEFSSAGDRVVFATYFSGATFTCANDSNPCTYFQPPANASPALILTTPSAIAVDAAGMVTIAGTTNSTGLPVNANSYATQCGCTNLNSVAFVARLAPGATKLVWGTYIPVNATVYAGIITGVPKDNITSLALDGSGDVILAGMAASGFPVSGNALQPAFPAPSGSNYSGYIAKLDSTGSKLLFSTWFGDAASGPAAVALDNTGAIWMTGGATPSSLPPSSGTPVLGGNYIAGISPDGASLLSLFTAPANATGTAIQVSAAGSVDALGTSGTLLMSSGTAGPSLLGIAASPSYTASNALVARELVSLYGIGLGPGSQVLFNGIPAWVIYSSANQINAVVPSALAGQETATISIVTPAGTLAGPTLPLLPTSPQVFADNSGDAMAVNQDGTLNSSANPAARGSIVAIWLTGGGAQTYIPDNGIPTTLRQNPYPVSILTADTQLPFPTETSLEVLYAGDAPGQPNGVIQVNFLLPPWATGLYTVQIGSATAAFHLWVRY